MTNYVSLHKMLIQQGLNHTSQKCFQPKLNTCSKKAMLLAHKPHSFGSKNSSLKYQDLFMIKKSPPFRIMKHHKT